MITLYLLFLTQKTRKNYNTVFIYKRAKFKKA